MTRFPSEIAQLKELIARALRTRQLAAAAKAELAKIPPGDQAARAEWEGRIRTYEQLFSVELPRIEVRIKLLRETKPLAAERLANTLNPKPRARRPQPRGPRKGRSPPRRPFHG